MIQEPEPSPSAFSRKDSIKQTRSRTRSHRTLSEEMEDNPDLQASKFNLFDEKVSIFVSSSSSSQISDTRLLQPAHPFLATLSSHPLSTRRASQVSIFTFRPRNNSEADFADDERSIHGDGRSRAGSMATPWHKRRTGSIRSHSSQVLTLTLALNGRLNVSTEQNGITGVGPHTPTSLPAISMEKVRDDKVSEYCKYYQQNRKNASIHIQMLRSSSQI